MPASRDIINSLPLLAAVLGRNYGVEVRIGGREAKTNGRVIHLPSLPLDCEGDLLGFARGFIDHEAAHIRHSDFKALREARLDPVTHTIANAIEDWRIEERQSALYPGCRCHFDWLARKLCLEDRKDKQEAGANPASCILEYVILATSAWAVPEIWAALHPVQGELDALFPGLRQTMDAVLDRAHAHCPDTIAAIDYAREIAKCLKQWQPPAPQQGMGQACETDGQQGQQEYQQEQGDTPDDGGSQHHEIPAGRNNQGQNRENDKAPHTIPETPAIPDVHSPTNKEENQTDCLQQSQEGGEATSPTAPITALFTTKEEDLPQTRGEYAAQHLTTQQTGPDHTALTVATVGTAKPATSPPAEREEALRASIALRSRLQGLLQAHRLRDVGTGRRGRLHTTKLYRLSTANPRVFRKEEERPGLNTAVHILLDVSGSMAGVAINLARQACYAVAKALHGTKGINPAVTSFPAKTPADSVCPLMGHGAKLPPYMDVGAGGSTPLAPALWWVMQTMLPLREHRKLILILTDGEPDAIAPTVKALEAASKAGFEVYAIGIKSTAIAHLLPQTSQCITTLAELAPAMFTLLQKALLYGGNHDRTP